MTPTIYKIEFPDGQFYIGSTCNFSARRQTHLRQGRKGKSINAKLQQAFATHPVCAIYQIASGFDRGSLHVLEQQVMDIEKPTLNVSKATPLPATNQGAAKEFAGFHSIAEFARANGLTYQQAKRERLKRSQPKIQKVSKKEVLSRIHNMPPDPRKHNRLFYQDDAWYDSAALRKTSGVNTKTYERRRKLGWGKLESCSTPPIPKVKKVVLPKIKKEPNVKRRYITAGGETRTLDGWATKLGISKTALHGRLHTGWTEAQTVGVEPPPNQHKADNAAARRAAKKLRRPRETYTFGGVTGNLSEVCRANSLNYTRVHYRLSAGWAQQEAFAAC
jgi:hypothetical protein